MRTKLAALIVPMMTLAFASGIATPARAGLINGSFEQYTGGYNGATSQLGTSTAGGYSVMNGWTLGSGTYGFLVSPGVLDTTGVHSPQFNNTFKLWGSNDGGLVTLPTISPDGGNFLALDAASGYRGAGISQVLTGLAKGQQYAVTFDWASGQQYGYDGVNYEAMQVTFGNQVQSTRTVTNVSHGFTGWQQETFVFTADDVSDTLNFLATGTPSGLPPMVLLDGVSFAAVPEPSSLVLVGLGLGVSAVVHRARRKKSATA